jgi:arginase
VGRPPRTPRRRGLDGFFIHLDADSLDDEVMPAVDYRLPGGLTLHELTTLLDTALRSGKAVGLELTIYNPELDGDGRAGRALAAAIVGALGAEAGAGYGHPGSRRLVSDD